MDIGDVLHTGWCDALIFVDAHAHSAPTDEKWDDKRGNFLFLSRWCVIVWATVRRRGDLCETSPSPFLLTKTLIHRNYTDGLKYTARQGITPIMQSWLKLGPHARVPQEHGRSWDVHQGSTERKRPVNICSRSTSVLLWTTTLKSNNVHFDGLLHEEVSALDKRQLLMLKSYRLLMKMDQCYSFADNRTQCTAQPISCVVSLHIATAFRHDSGDKSFASEDHSQRRERERDKGTEEKNGRLRIKE